MAAINRQSKGRKNPSSNRRIKIQRIETYADTYSTGEILPMTTGVLSILHPSSKMFKDKTPNVAIMDIREEKRLNNRVKFLERKTRRLEKMITGLADVHLLD